MSEYGEPWRIERRRWGRGTGVLLNAEGDFIAGESSDEGAFDLDNAAYLRIVVCVNFLAGIPTADLVAIMANRMYWDNASHDIYGAADAAQGRCR